MNAETEKFIDIRENFSKILEKVQEFNEISAWNFYINSNEENLKSYEKVQDEMTKLFSDKQTYEKFLSINKNKLPAHEQKQLKNLLKAFDERLNSGELFKALEKKENEIAQKYNSYIAKIDGKEISKPELSKILQTEIASDLREKAYDAVVKGGDLIAEDLVELVKMRNEFAKTKSFDNFFDYRLKEEFDTDIKFLDELINQVYSGAKNKIETAQQKTYNELKQIYGTEKLEGYHYGLLTDSNPEKEVNKILENYNIESICKNAYKGMGYDIEALIKNGNLTTDLYPRKGKNTHGFAFCIKAGQDARILANLRNDSRSIDTLNHELGHCIYDLGLSEELPFIDREPASSAFTEAIAMMMGDLHKKENILNDIIPSDILTRYKNSLKDDEANFISKSLLIIGFERELYKNPTQNPAKLWADLRLKYRNQDFAQNNEWATIPHYLSHPAYYQNYFRAALIKAQIYSHLNKTLGNITENTKTAKYLKDNIFSKGATIEEYDLVKHLTGRNFSAEAYINTL